MANFSLFSEKPPRSMDEFEFLQDPRDKNSRLGIGSFATVKLAREKKTGRLVALKIVDLENSKNKASDLHNLRIEVHVHKRISHDNIIKYHGYFTEKNMVYIILDYAEKGNLYGYIHKKRVLSPEEIFRFFYQTCLSIEYLHQQDVMHRDIKPENLLLDKDINIKLCDLGWCAERIKDKRTTFCGTYEYMAPEIVYKKQYDYKVDIWSLGVLLYELIHKEAPYKGRSLNEILNSLTKTTMTFSPSIDPQARDLIIKILRVNPSERPSIREILQHPWVMYNLRLNEHSANGFSSVRSNVLASRENQNLKAMSRDRSEKHIQNIAQIYNKNKKASQAAISIKDVSESAKREGHEEQGSEIYYKNNPKPSSSLCKNPLELDIEERKELNRRRNIYMSRNAELKRQGSLSSAITGSTMTPLSGQHSNDSNMSILPGTSNAKRNVIGLQTPNAVESTYQVGIAAVAGAFSNNLVAKEQQIGSLKSLSNIGSVNSLDSIGPEPTNGVSPSAIPKLNKIRTQTGPGLHPLMNARPGGTPNALEMLYSTGVTTTRLPSHQKALSIINESGLSRRLVTDNHSGSMPIQVRQMNNGSVTENQKYPNLMGATSENIKAINKGMKGIISPVAWSGRRIFIKSRGDLNGKSKENNAIEQYQSIENKKGKSPSIDYDIRGPETPEIVNIPGNNFANQLDGKDNLIITPAEDFGAVKMLKRLTKEKRSVNKENRILLDGSLNGLEGAKNRIEIHYRSNYN